MRITIWAMLMLFCCTVVCMGEIIIDANYPGGNIVVDNSQGAPGRYSGISIADSTRMIVTGNRVGADGQAPTQKFGIEEAGASDSNVITGNVCEGNLEGAIRVVGEKTQCGQNVGGVDPSEKSPAATPSDHLR